MELSAIDSSLHAYTEITCSKVPRASLSHERAARRFTGESVEEMQNGQAGHFNPRFFSSLDF